MSEEATFAEWWQRFRNGKQPIAVYVAASLVAGLALAGVSMGMAYLIGVSRTGRGGRGDVRDAEILLALAVAGVAWSFLLSWMWRAAATSRRGPVSVILARIIRPACVTVAIAVGCVVCGVAIDSWRLDDSEYAIAALALVGGAVAMGFWLPAIGAIGRGRPVLRPDQQVDLRCPDCGYTLVGLTEARCPECGSTFTLDELVRAQGFDLPAPAVGRDGD